MERLTKRGAQKNGYVSAIGSGFGCWGQIIDRLAAYEDTGFMPDDVTDLMAAHGTAIGALAEYRALGTVKELRALVDAPPNTPLTLEELRAMEGPVWVVVYNLPQGGYYCLCNKGVITAPSGRVFDCGDIPDWTFLRHKPEEV